MPKPLVTLRSISKRFSPEREILHNLDFTLAAGECAAVFGPSGSGKSTLLNILGLIFPADGGEYYFHGERIDVRSESQHLRLRREHIGFVFQNFRLLQRLTALENVFMPLLLRGVRMSVARQRAREVLEELSLTHVAAQYPSTLSGGEQQRVSLARAVISEPSLIIADEPTGNLDAKSGEQVLGILRSLCDQGKSVLLATHSADAAQIADSVYALQEGRLIAKEQLAQVPG